MHFLAAAVDTGETVDIDRLHDQPQQAAGQQECPDWEEQVFPGNERSLRGRNLHQRKTAGHAHERRDAQQKEAFACAPVREHVAAGIHNAGHQA